MSYQYDIFISYKRNPETLQWINNHFMPLLKFRVELELGSSINIFLDDNIESGVSWAHQLGADLGRSKILVPLWSRTFFSSDWCTHELSRMLAREEETGCRTAVNPRGLIVPAIIHDGDTFPAEINGIQHFRIQQCFNVRMSADSRRAEELDDILASEAPAIAAAIRNAPAWQAAWSEDSAQSFYNLLKSGAPAQNDLPRFTT